MYYYKMYEQSTAGTVENRTSGTAARRLPHTTEPAAERQVIKATAGNPLPAGDSRKPALRKGPLKLRKQTHFATWPRTAIYCGATSSQEIRGAVVFESKANEAVSDSLVARNVG